MKRTSRILLATDFGPASRGATSQAVRLARSRGVPLLVAHVVELPVPDPYGASLEAAREQEARANRLMQRLTAAIEKQGVKTESQLLVGRPGTMIVRLAEKTKPVILVVGTERLRGMRRFILGSVAERVLRHAPCPVLVAIPSARGPFRKILHATDFSPKADAALELAVSLARMDGGNVSLLHVLDANAVEAISVAPVPTLAAGRFSRSIYREARDRLRGLASRRRIRPRVSVVWDTNPATAIVREAAKDRADVIALGTQGRTGISGFLIGNTAERVARDLPCSLLCVR